jgi:hypothetical protein
MPGPFAVMEAVTVIDIDPRSGSYHGKKGG